MIEKSQRRIGRIFFTIAGCLSLGAGVAGIFLPVLPTVPLLLLAATCFARSSEKCHSWLLNHARLGPIISPFLDGEGIPRHAKIKAILLLWTSLLVSILFFIPLLWVDILVFIVGICVSLYLIRLPIRK